MSNEKIHSMDVPAGEEMQTNSPVTENKTEELEKWLDPLLQDDKKIKYTVPTKLLGGSFHYGD